jgi:hypothetical protein
VIQFVDDAADALMSWRMELSRALDWIENDRPAHWQQRIRDAWTEVSEARAALELSRNRSVSGQRAASRDEIIALENARQQVRHAEEMTVVVRQWSQKLRHDINQHDGQITRLENYLNVDLARSLAALDRIISALESYVSKAAPREETGGESAARPTES